MAKQKPKPRIDPEFSALLGEHSPEEKAQLKANLDDDGQREPIVVWKEQNLIVEGNTRYELLRELGAVPKITYLSFPDRDAAIEWIFKQQFGRRNLTKEQRAVVMANHVALLRRQAEQKKAAEELERSSANNPPRHPGRPVTTGDVTQKVADAAGVSRRTATTVLSVFCDRCKRVGVRKGCEDCKSLQDAAGGKKKTSGPKGKSGRAVIDWKNYERCLGVVVRLVDEVNRHYPDAVTAKAKKEYLAAAGELVELKKQWQSAAKGK